MNDTIIEEVRKVLEKHPEARNSYNWLWYYYMTEIAKIKVYVPFEALNGQKPIPSVESITRACRKIQNDENMLKPCFEVQQARQENELRVKQWATKGVRLTSFSGGNYEL